MSISVVADESDVIVPVVAATGESSPAGDSIAATENDTGMIFRTKNTRFLFVRKLAAKGERKC